MTKEIILILNLSFFCLDRAALQVHLWNIPVSIVRFARLCNKVEDGNDRNSFISSKL